jgi:hypothetical protein
MFGLIQEASNLEGGRKELHDFPRTLKVSVQWNRGSLNVSIDNKIVINKVSKLFARIVLDSADRVSGKFISYHRVGDKHYAFQSKSQLRALKSWIKTIRANDGETVTIDGSFNSIRSTTTKTIDNGAIER